MSNYAITQLPISHGKVLRETKTRLATVSSTPSLDAQVLLAHITGKPRTWLLAHPEALLSPHEFQQIEEALQKLESGFPLPYLLGEREFFGLKFKVTPDTLIPRPETELLVETALAWLKQLPSPTERGTKGEGIYAADIGTGTGCIAVSLAAHCPELHVVATDLSPAALAVAQHNAEIHYVSDRITFLEADLLSFHSFGQRLKIAAELKVSSAKNVLYIMDEPTTGLHVEDIKKLLAMLQKLVNSGNTVVVVEHNLDVIKSADWIIDLGPEGGSAGGHIVAEGRPEQVAKITASHTGRFLAPLLAYEQKARQRL